MPMPFAKFERVLLKKDSELDEHWVQARIADDPKILGLGDLDLRDKERRQPRAGRLDLLLEDSEELHRYEVEVQLGSTDESHIIRTIEYWDIERKRYPQYEHTAVIVAENITARFLNVISLFNGSIPLVAVQMSALQYDGHVGLFFTTVLDHVPRGLDDEGSDGEDEATDRAYWEKRGSPATVAMADQSLRILKKFDAALELKYNKQYIGLAKDGHPWNFVLFRPKRTLFRIEPRLEKSDEIEQRLTDSGLDVSYDNTWNRYRISIPVDGLAKHSDLITEILRQAYDKA